MGTRWDERALRAPALDEQFSLKIDSSFLKFIESLDFKLFPNILL